MSAYYNEHDPKKAAWLRDLIKRNRIAPGDVDERSIEDVLPNELAGYAQCHFFAGVGVWSYALRNAGWPDDRPVWTGSCPCQPFSTAGKGDGFADERHLWPAWFHLIQQRNPDVVFGEQVESKDGRAWLDVVQADLEANSYAVGPVGLCAAGFGAPHIRQRLFFVADASGPTSQRNAGSIPGAQAKVSGQNGTKHGNRVVGFADGRTVGSLANANGSERRPPAQGRNDDANGANAGRQEAASGFELCGEAGQLGDSALNESRPFNGQSGEGGRQEESVRGSGFSGELGESDSLQSEQFARQRARPGEEEGRRTRGQFAGSSETGATNGFWGNAEWLYCRDNKYRAVEPCTFPLVDGAAARVGRLSGYGDAIVAPVAEAFIAAYMEATK